VVPPLLGVTPIFALSFWAYDVSQKLIRTITPNRTSQTLSTAELAAAGFLSAVPTTLVTAPVERAKVLLQVQGQGSEKKYKGVIDVIRVLYREGGLPSIFRGSVATIMRDGPGSAAYFAAYEVVKKALTPKGADPSQLNLGAIIVAGGSAGVAMWSIAIPPDVIKSRIQSAPNGTYSGFLDCARKTIAADGVKALWKGFGPAMARAFPANAATFTSGSVFSRIRWHGLDTRSKETIPVAVEETPPRYEPSANSQPFIAPQASHQKSEIQPDLSTAVCPFEDFIDRITTAEKEEEVKEIIISLEEITMSTNDELTQFFSALPSTNEQPLISFFVRALPPRGPQRTSTKASSSKESSHRSRHPSQVPGPSNHVPRSRRREDGTLQPAQDPEPGIVPSLSGSAQRVDITPFGKTGSNTVSMIVSNSDPGVRSLRDYPQRLEVMIQARFLDDDCGPLYISDHPVSLFAASVEPSVEPQNSLAEERGALHGLRTLVEICRWPTPLPKLKDSKSFHKNCAFQRVIDRINVTEEKELKTVVKGLLDSIVVISHKQGILPSAFPAVRCAIETCKKHEEISLHSIFYDTKCLRKSPVVWIILNAKSDDPKQ
ncbi:hypothetical protein M422DRAFT_250071, partial [Sphaerobolus stellatus SS14]